jgi:hypothetical protein
MQAVAPLLADIDTGMFSLLDLPQHCLKRTGALVKRYRALPLALVDATGVDATEMLKEDKLDHRHFSVVHPAHVGALRLLP